MSRGNEVLEANNRVAGDVYSGFSNWETVAIDSTVPADNTKDNDNDRLAILIPEVSVVWEVDGVPVKTLGGSPFVFHPARAVVRVPAGQTISMLTIAGLSDSVVSVGYRNAD